MKDVRRKVVSFLALFGSTSTLICCALPAMVAAVAGGSAVAFLVSAFPFLITLSRYKLYFFVFAGAMLLLAGVVIFRPKSRVACSVAGEGCEVASRFSRIIFMVSVLIYAVGFFFAYLSVPLMRWLGL